MILQNKMIKKIFVGLLIVVIAALLLIQFIVPSQTSTKREIIIATTEGHVFDFLTHRKSWVLWWPGKVNFPEKEYSLNNSTFTFQKASNSGVDLTIENGSAKINSKLTFIAADKGWIKIRWQADEILSNNPLKKLSQFLGFRNTDDDITNILNHLKIFFEDDKNVYKLDIKLAKVKDSVVLVKQVSLQQYPEANQIYNMVNTLKREISMKNALQVDSPMLNVNQVGNRYDVMVGIPINKVIPAGKGTFLNKLVLGNILRATVVGGPDKVRRSVKQLENYRRDYGLVAPAMPFQQLITNRLSQKDTTKWVTDLYYPIF
jgi:hypothetical protein